jgi:hypothetical protein
MLRGKMVDLVLPRLASTLVLATVILVGSCKLEPKPTVYDFSCRKVAETSGATSWIFEGKYKPPLRLDGGLGFLESVNKALEAASLPVVTETVPEASEVSGSRADRTKYRWQAYPRGLLTLARSLCTDAEFRDYDCIWKITLD